MFLWYSLSSAVKKTWCCEQFKTSMSSRELSSRKWNTHSFGAWILRSFFFAVHMKHIAFFARCFFANLPFFVQKCIGKTCYGTGLNFQAWISDKLLSGWWWNSRVCARFENRSLCWNGCKAKVHKPKILTIIEQMPLLYTFCYSYYNCKSKAVDTRWAVIILRRSLMTSRYDFSTITVLWGTFDCLCL